MGNEEDATPSLGGDVGRHGKGAYLVLVWVTETMHVYLLDSCVSAQQSYLLRIYECISKLDTRPNVPLGRYVQYSCVKGKLATPTYVHE